MVHGRRLSLLLLMLAGGVILAVPVSAAPPKPAPVAGRAHLVESEASPVRQVRRADGTLFADLGQAMFGWLRVARHVPFDDAASSFACSDPALVEVWDLCKHSIKATSFLGLYVDGDRERIPYEADAFINQLCHYGVDAHSATGRFTHEHLLAHPT